MFGIQKVFQMIGVCPESETPAVGFLLDVLEFQKSNMTSCVPELHNIFRR